MTGQFLYTRLAITRSLTGVETEKGSERVPRLSLNGNATEVVKKRKSS